MSTAPGTPQIDLEKIKAEAAAAVAGMSQEQLAAEFLKIRTRQKTQQKKQQDKGAQKEYMKKKNLRDKLIREAIEASGKAEELNAQADVAAETAFKAYLETKAEEGGDEEAA
jgi:hypothetical protein